MKTPTHLPRRGTLLLTAGLVAVAVVVIVLCMTFVKHLDDRTTSETNRYLTEVANHVATTINDRLSSTLRTLHSISETYAQLRTSNDQEQADAYLVDKAVIYGYMRLGLVDQDGYYRGTDGHTASVGDLPYIQRAMAGESLVVNLDTSPIDGSSGILYAVPYYEDAAVVGVMTCWSGRSHLNNILSVESFGGEGFSHIVTNDGNFVVKSNNHNSPAGDPNFFDTLENRATIMPGYSLEVMRHDIAEDKSGMLYFALEDGNVKALCYQSLSPDNWYLLSVVPTKVATATYTTLLNEAIVTNVLIVVLFLILILIVVYINRRSRQRLETIAYVDPVTGGANRSRFEEQACRCLDEAVPGKRALVSLDLRRFKLFNDAFGSEQGNRLLRYIYTVIVRHLRADEYVARIAADTFDLLLDFDSEQDTRQRLLCLAEDINTFNNHLADKYFLQIVCGVYVIDEPALDLVILQDRANAARTTNKTGVGRTLCDCFFYSRAQHAQMLRERDMENHMHSALHNGEFVVYLQPQVDLSTGSIAGAETLVRWQTADGLLPPDEFLPLFEKNGFIVRLDLYVFETACRLLRTWIDSGETPVPLSVNLSQSHLQTPAFMEQYRTIVERYAVPPALLEIELTETMAFDNRALLMTVIDQIHALGFTCALDDFGSGYSSLNVLKELPVDTMKLDRAFFQHDLHSDKRSRDVIDAVVSLARRLHMRSVAEGIENREQLAFLKQIHCDMVQGYVFSKPMPTARFEEALFGRVLSGASETPPATPVPPSDAAAAGNNAADPGNDADPSRDDV